jgi:hypothetical protein
MIAGCRLRGVAGIRAARRDAAMSACRCGMCQRLSGRAKCGSDAPAHAFAATWPVRTYRRSAGGGRASRATCGGHLRFREDGGGYARAPRRSDATAEVTVAGEVHVDRTPVRLRPSGDHRQATAAGVAAGHPHV